MWAPLAFASYCWLGNGNNYSGHLRQRWKPHIEDHGATLGHLDYLPPDFSVRENEFLVEGTAI